MLCLGKRLSLNEGSGRRLTIGELLSRGDETSKLDSSSGTSPYILPRMIAFQTILFRSNAN